MSPKEKIDKIMLELNSQKKYGVVTPPLFDHQNLLSHNQKLIFTKTNFSTITPQPRGMNSSINSAINPYKPINKNLTHVHGTENNNSFNLIHKDTNKIKVPLTPNNDTKTREQHIHFAT
jgi:hypothetical protein